MNKKIKLLMVPSDLAGVGHFRSIWPAQSIEKNFSDEVEIEINSNPNVNDIEYFQKFDIIHFHRHIGPYENSEELFKKIKEKGTILILDIDDFWEPPTTHPLYHIVKKENFSKKIINNIKLADYVTTTTEIFAKYISKYNPNVFVIPNAINKEHPMWASEVEENKTEKCRISWVGGSCYDEKTEILTENGFKFFKDLNTNEKVACLNPENNNLEYHIPHGYIKEKYKGKLNNGVNNLIDYAVTPNHKMYVSIANKLSEKKLNLSLIESEKVHGKNMHFKKDAIWIGEEKKTFTIPKLKIEVNSKLQELILNNNNLELEDSMVGEKAIINNKAVIIRRSLKNNNYIANLPLKEKYNSDKIVDMDLWLQFFGFWIAEGWVTKTKGLFQVGIAQSKDNDYLEKMFNVLIKMGYNPTYTKDRKQIRVFDKQLWAYLKQFGEAQEKFIPKEIMNLSSRQLNIFLEWYLKGDGSLEKGGVRYDKRKTKENIERGLVNFNSHRRRGYTTSKKLADNIQEICLKIGVISSVSNRGKRSAKIKYNRIINGKHDAYVISIGSNGIRAKKTPLLKSEEQFQTDYDGYVYCVNVPNNIIYIRRNGKTMWCGNSHLHDLELMRPGFQQLWKDDSLENKFQIIMCGFDTRGSVTEINEATGEKRTRKIKPSETVWRKFEEIFTDNFNERKKDEEYYKWLDKIVKAKDEDYKTEQYNKNYVRRWTLPLTQYAKHYDYCDVCLAPLIDYYMEEMKIKKGGKISKQLIKRRHIFNEVKSELKIIEAGMKKKVLIAQDFGIYSKLIEDGKNGLLVKDNKKDWYNHMKRVIEDPIYREELANNLHEFVKDKYCIDNVTKDRVEIYKNLISKHNNQKYILKGEFSMFERVNKNGPIRNLKIK